jgi:hypothetical protein
MKWFLLIFILNVQSAQAMPKHFEVWMLSIDKTADLNELLDKTKLTRYSKAFSQSSARQCQPMGDYCFDPQIGLYKKDESTILKDVNPAKAKSIDINELENNEKYQFMEVPKSVDRNLINCDKSNFFDIFCGKAKKLKKAAKTKLEVWIDVSSTMRQVDFPGFEKKCQREVFLDRLSQTCPIDGGLKVYYFEEFRKEAGLFDRACLSGGLNDMKRIMKDLEKSTADNVIIITDIFEAHIQFIDAIEAAGVGVIRGLDKPMYARDVTRQLQRVRKFCK